MGGVGGIPVIENENNCLSSLNRVGEYQIPISCFFEDIEPMFKISKNLLTDIKDFPARVFFKISDF